MDKGAIGFSLYLITDRRLTGGTEEGLLRAVELALEGGLRAVQLREKDLDGATLLGLARRLRELTHRYGAALFINDRVDVALLSNADGVHLPEDSFSPSCIKEHFGGRLLVGRSCHCVESVRDSIEGGADFVTLGPVYDTPSKRPFGKPIGVEPIKAAAALGGAVFALGGVKREHVADLIRCGAHGVAVISAILGAEDIKGATEALIEEIEKTKKEVILK